MKTNPQVVFILGGPGAGKGTQCLRIQKDFGFLHISAGDCLRDERQRHGSEFGEIIEEHIKAGTIVPVDITCALLKNKMLQLGWHNGRFLIDGFPRNQDNLDGWIKAMDSDVEVKLCLVIDCPENVMQDRIMNRGNSSGRSDDNAESIMKRFITYRLQTQPIIEVITPFAPKFVQHFEKNGLCTHVDEHGDSFVHEMCLLNEKPIKHKSPMFVRRRIRDIVKHSAELMLLTKKCIRCAMQPAIVHCDTCSILLCSACLIIDDHPVSHKLNTLDSAVVACEQTRAPSAIRRQLTHILREPENRATHVCLKCNYRPVDDYEQHQGHSLAEVDQGADILRPLIQQELPEKMELIGLIKSQRFEAEETIMIAKENEDLCADNLLSAQKIIENMIERSYETGSSTILTMWKDSTDALNLGIQSIDQRKQNLISKIIAFERALELGRSHAAAGILAYLKALNILEKQSIHDIENTCEDVQTKILAVKQMKTSLIEQVATVSHTIEKHIHQYLAETEFDRYELPDGYTPPENVESQLMDLRTSHKIADLTGVPLNTGDKVTQSTIPYWTLREAPNITDVLLRIDTFHPSWEQVRVSIYHKQWLTIHAVSKSGSMPALNSPPECVIPLWETTIRHFESKELGGGSFSPVAQVLAKAGNSGIEIIRYKIDGTPLTYWILGCTEPQTVKKWAKILTKYSTRSRTAGHKGAFTPSTNPAINVKDLGIFMPAEKWAASHAISGTNVALAGEDADNITNQNSYCAVE